LSSLIRLLCEIGRQDPSGVFPCQSYRKQDEVVPEKPANSGCSLINTSCWMGGVGINPNRLRQGQSQIGFRHVWMASLNMLCPCVFVQRDLDSIWRHIYGRT
jgi:hypothetical protein